MALSKTELESKLWQAADILRGQIDAADYKNYIFSLLFLKTALGPLLTRRWRMPWRRVFRAKLRLGTRTSTSSSSRQSPGGTLSWSLR